VTNAEAERLRAPHGDGWRRWGTYLAERAWGTVREDYSADGDAWTYFPHDHACSRAYRWSEDGLAGWSDDKQRVCLALAVWNGNDPMLKERLFGLDSHEGNHGEDVKERWWFLDNTPTHSYARWRYHYPQAEFPYDQLVAENARRTRDDPEFEIGDTGVFEHGRWNIEVEYAKASLSAVVMQISVRNDGPEPATLHVLPTVWFRNTWSWGYDPTRPELAATDGRITGAHDEIGGFELTSSPPAPTLVCDNDTNVARLYGDPSTPFPKDGINDHVVHGLPTVNPAGTGTKAAFHHVVTLAPGASTDITVVLAPLDAEPIDAAATLVRGRRDADEFYADRTPSTASPTEATVLRQAFAGLLWCKQLYHYDVAKWLDGDPIWPAPSERRNGRNAEWHTLDAFDIVSMPDTWEYPWFAAWDLAFHCVALSFIDAAFAKAQLILLCREWYQHPNGELPAYEWSFSDANPPVHAWAALRVFEIDGSTDYTFLARVFHKLLINFTWWVNRKDTQGNNVFEGGFLGLDNIGPFDRSSPVPGGGTLEQSDGTAWMAKYCLDMLAIALTLADHDPAYEDVATKFFEHFAYIATAAEDLWQEDDGFYEDQLHFPDGSEMPLRVRSMVGLIPLTAVALLDDDLRTRLANFDFHVTWFEENKPEYAHTVSHALVPGMDGRWLLSIVGPDRLTRVLEAVFDEDEFLSPHGLRSLSRRHRDQPFVLQLGGMEYRVDYEPGESRSGLFGGNSNWRGPVWMPLNVLVLEALRLYERYLGSEFVVEIPSRSGQLVPLQSATHELARRLIGLFEPDEQGGVLFYEYYHGDTGAGLGADHQTGWTAMVASLILILHNDPQA
jgi:hypothetical protein